MVVWIDRCSPDWAAVLEAGEFDLPPEYAGYPIVIRYTCGELVEPPEGEDLAELEAASGFGAIEPDTLKTAGLVALGVFTVGAILYFATS